jgi:hypothetical protein
MNSPGQSALHQAKPRRLTRIGAAVPNPVACALACVLSLAALACSAAPQRDSRVTTDVAGAGSGTGGAPGTVIAEAPTCAADNPFCGSPTSLIPVSTGSAGTAAMPSTSMCGALPIDVQAAGVNIMIAVDGSSTTTSHWPDIVTAIRSLRENNPTAAFGLHLFWGKAIDVLGGQDNANTSNNACAGTENKMLELGNYTAQMLVDFLGTAPPGESVVGALPVSPVIDPMTYYLTNTTKLADPKRTNYLLVFTTGNDNCFGSIFAANSDKLLAYQKLATELYKLDIRVIPVGLDPPPTAASTAAAAAMPPPLFPDPTMAIPTDYDVLGTLLSNGGSDIKDVPRIDTPAKLAELVSRVGQTINSCRFDLPDSLDSNLAVNPFELAFSIRGVVVARDRTEMNGWNFVAGKTNQVEFYGQGCEALQSGQVLEANKSCDTNVCGTAAVSVETRSRAVLLLMDGSASRIECVDESTDCLSVPGTPGRVLSFWEVVEHAVSTALVAPVNDDVAFGMQFFPAKTADSLSCDVAAAPEITPAPGSQISVMKAMLEKLPFGLSPVVGVMESVAAAPGKLADPGVLGAVVLLSDGGDNCSGATEPEIVSRLGAAAKKLFDAKIKTYAVRYGSVDGETPEQAEQLNAIVSNGGTALAGASVQYIDAKSPAELTSALASISDQLATCSFTLSGIDPTVDKNRTNLYLNGEPIGFDAQATKQDGWNWVDPERTVVELYGPACTAFKTNPRTRVVAEFGCEPVIVKGPD